MSIKNGLGEVGRGQIMYDLLGHGEDFVFYSKYSAKSFNGYRQESNTF